MRKIYLVGFMGCGKSAIGRRLSYFLKMPLYDMDQEIVSNKECRFQKFLKSMEKNILEI